MQVFHNPSEVAEIHDFWIGEKHHKGAIIIEDMGATDRVKSVDDNVPNIHKEDITVYVPLEVIGKVPRKGLDFELSDKIYKITKAREDVGEVVLTLEVRVE